MGLLGAIRFAVIATRPSAMMTISPASAPLFSQKYSQVSCKGCSGWLRLIGRFSVWAAIVLPHMPNAGVDQAIHQIDEQIDQDDDRGDQQGAALEHPIISPIDGPDQPSAHAGPGKDRLRQDSPRHKGSDLKSDDG